MKKKYPRDLVGYGSKKIKVKWPGNAKLALQFVLNYEEGAENCILHGDKTSEVFLSEIIGAKPIKGRHLNMESIYEYGSRRGFWRIHDLFNKKKIPLTIFGVGMALERNKDVCSAIKKANYEVASHSFITMGHGRALINIESPAEQIKLYKTIVKKGLSVRETEALVRKSKAPKQSSETPYQPAYIQQAADDLEKLFDTAVSLNANSLGRGQLKISFESQEKLQNILNKIKGEA